MQSSTPIAIEKILETCETELAAQVDRLPHIVEKWVSINNTTCRIAVCQSQYGLHWELGSGQAGILQPAVLFQEDQRQAMTRLLTLLKNLPRHSF